MQKNTIIIALLVLVIGLTVGYEVGTHSIICSGAIDRNSHVMANGEVMSNDSHTSMAGMMGDMNAVLRGKTGDEFDKAFLAEMIVHHEGAVSMAELALQNAKHQEIKNLASDIIDAQNKEIASMKAWQSGWYAK